MNVFVRCDTCLPAAGQFRHLLQPNFQLQYNELKPSSASLKQNVQNRRLSATRCNKMRVFGLMADWNSGGRACAAIPGTMNNGL